MKSKNFIIAMFLVFFCAVCVEAQEPIFIKSTARSLSAIKVARLIKSDLVILENGQKIRLIGVKGFDAPRKTNRPADQYGFVIEDVSDPTILLEDRAYDFSRELLSQKKVRVEYDVKSIDSEGYLLGYLFLLDGTLVNAELLRQGYAHLHLQPPNLKYANQLREAYREARFEKRGIHAE